MLKFRVQGGTVPRCPPPSVVYDFGAGAGELRVLRVREHPLSMQVHPLTAKGTPSK